MDTRGVLDGERRITFLKPLPVSSEGRRFEVRSKVIGVYDKGKPGTVVETEQTLVDAQSGEVYSRAVGSGFYVGQGGWGGPKGRCCIPLRFLHSLDERVGRGERLNGLYQTGLNWTEPDVYANTTIIPGPKTVNYPPPQGKQPDATYAFRTTPETALLYRLNGDYNPLHATPEPGVKMGFGGPIIHGLFSWNCTAHGVLQRLGGSDPANIKEFQARFASPVKPGDKLVTEMWKTGAADKDGFEEVRFVTKVDGGKVCLSNGRALVRCVGSAKGRLLGEMKGKVIGKVPTML